jgi:hypothetical protein
MNLQFEELGLGNSGKLLRFYHDSKRNIGTPYRAMLLFDSYSIAEAYASESFVCGSFHEKNVEP